MKRETRAERLARERRNALARERRAKAKKAEKRARSERFDFGANVLVARDQDHWRAVMRQEARGAKPTVRRYPGGKNAVAGLVKKHGAAEAARRLGVTEGTAKSWARKGPSAKGQDAARGAWERSERARKAASARVASEHVLQRQGPLAAVLKPRKMTAAKELQWREVVNTRRALLAANDPDWIAHKREMLSRGFSTREAINRWMSPKHRGKK